jgi:xanthine dehydrogenase/oxidase
VLPVESVPVGERTHYGQVVDNVNLHRMWNEVHSLADVEARREEVSTFNAANRYKKRGISVLPVCYGINFGQPLLNQAGALVLIYTGMFGACCSPAPYGKRRSCIPCADGSVLVTHGGVEMGQGLHTKVAQIAAQTLDIPVSLVYVEETATDKVRHRLIRRTSQSCGHACLVVWWQVPNSSPTAASASTDLYGGAVADACQQLKARLAPIFAADPKLSWKVGFVSLAGVGMTKGVPLLCCRMLSRKRISIV